MTPKEREARADIDAAASSAVDALPRLELAASAMTARDVFAMHILAGFAANPNPDAGITMVEVLRAYAIADHAMAVRAKVHDSTKPPT